MADTDNSTPTADETPTGPRPDDTVSEIPAVSEDSSVPEDDPEEEAEASGDESIFCVVDLHATTVAYELPPRLLVLLHDGLDLDQAFERLVGTPGIGKAQGVSGYLTHGYVPRLDAYAAAMAFALARFAHPELWGP